MSVSASRVDTLSQTASAEEGTPGAAGVSRLLPIMGVVFVAFFVVGMPLPVLPLYVHHELGLSEFVVGIITGSQFAASLLSRVWAGRFADQYGAKRAVLLGLAAAVLSGVLYLASILAAASAAVLLCGRAILGAAESFIITGSISWGLALAGPARAGRVIAWVGMAMFAALAMGAPAGAWLYEHGGFVAVAAVVTGVPVFTALLVAPLKSIATRPAARAGLMKVIGAVWLPGVGSALSSVGFGVILTFSSLLSLERSWSPVWLSFTAFGSALVLARLFLGEAPDRLGGAKVALVSIVIEAAGLALMWLATGRGLATTGAALAGLGYALVYPGFGAEAVRRAPADSQGLAMGAYTVFLDVALGLGNPMLGLLAGMSGLGSVFIIAAAVTLCSAIVAVVLIRRPMTGTV